MRKVLPARFVSRVVHLLASGYIIGSCFSHFFTDYITIQTDSRVVAFNWLFGILITLTGLSGIFLILYQKRPTQLYGVWEYLLVFKLILCIFLTPLTDFIVLRVITNQSSMAELAMQPVESTQKFRFYVALSKFLVMCSILILSSLAHFWRYEITHDF